MATLTVSPPARGVRRQPVLATAPPLRRLAVKGVLAIPLLIQGALRAREGGQCVYIYIYIYIYAAGGPEGDGPDASLPGEGQEERRAAAGAAEGQEGHIHIYNYICRYILAIKCIIHIRI